MKRKFYKEAAGPKLMSFRRTAASGLMILLLGLGSGSKAESPTPQTPVPAKPVPSEQPLSRSEIERRITTECDTMPLGKRLEYLFSSITRYQGEDGMVSGSGDGSYLDDGSRCVGHSDEIDNYTLTLRTIRSRPGESCKIDGAMTLSIQVEGVRYIVQIPDYHRPSSGEQMALISGNMPVGSYNLVIAAKSCESTMPRDECKRLAELTTDQISAGFCELYKRVGLKKSI